MFPKKGEKMKLVHSFALVFLFVGISFTTFGVRAEVDMRGAITPFFSARSPRKAIII